MLGGELRACIGGDIIVDVPRGNGAASIFVFILEQVLPWHVLQGFDDIGDAPIGQRKPPLLARLALEMEMQCRAGDVDMPGSKGRQPKTLVFAGISRVADPDETVVQQPDHGHDNTLKVEAAATQIGLHLFTQAGQRVGKRAKRIELGGAAMLSPVGVVSVASEENAE